MAALEGLQLGLELTHVAAQPLLLAARSRELRVEKQHLLLVLGQRVLQVARSDPSVSRRTRTGYRRRSRSSDGELAGCSGALAPLQCCGTLPVALVRAKFLRRRADWQPCVRASVALSVFCGA